MRDAHASARAYGFSHTRGLWLRIARMSPKPDRDAILARRRILVVSALAGAVATSCKSQPCLNIAMPPSDASPVTTAPDAGTSPDASGTQDAESAAVDAGEADAKPHPCLGASPPPQVCLKVGRPPTE